MAEPGPARTSGAGGAAQRAGRFAAGLAGRIARSFAQLEPAQRLAVYGALAMVVTMFLPWYSKSVTAIVTQGRDQALAKSTDTLSAWTAFSFVEAATLLVAGSVLLLLFRRGEGRAFHLPGGDGTVIAAAGGWAAFLIFYRLLDQPDEETTRTLVTTYGLRWGIFLALGAAIFLASAGVRLRAARVLEPPLPAAVRTPRRPVPPVIDADPVPAAAPAPAPAAPPAAPVAEDPPTGATRVDSSLQPTRVAPDGRPRARATAPAPPARPPAARRDPADPGDAGGQLSFDEREM
ncbi:hypothetical protein [Paraconexibacter algicola]|uniref:Uncharacterized protein n=1 Tax=Paraconexibacter algicola TaxID=2133960 RepID=A0A2T4UFI7_9ACTN|nr:hypothetical protein [Paraconexibacter algicola]PTL56547.1 hypothetical protein C7Y72_16490 [Paraconexibacter algicola]